MVGKSESLYTIVNEHRCTEITLVSSSGFLFRAWLHIQTTLRCVLFSSQHRERDTVPHMLSCSLITQWKHSHSSIEDCVTVCDRHMQVPETYSTANISFSFFVRCLCNWYCPLVYKRTAMVSIEIWQEKPFEAYMHTSQNHITIISHNYETNTTCIYKNNNIFKMSSKFNDMSKYTFIFPFIVNVSYVTEVTF